MLQAQAIGLQATITTERTFLSNWQQPEVDAEASVAAHQEQLDELMSVFQQELAAQKAGKEEAAAKGLAAKEHREGQCSPPNTIADT